MNLERVRKNIRCARKAMQAWFVEQEIVFAMIEILKAAENARTLFAARAFTLAAKKLMENQGGQGDEHRAIMMEISSALAELEFQEQKRLTE